MAIGAFDSEAFDVLAFGEDAFLFEEAGVTVPDVIGQSQADGTASLESDGFTVSVQTAHSSIVAAGDIISQAPEAGSEAPAGSTITITVSLGEAVQEEQPSGGGYFLYHYEREMAQRRREKKRREEAEEESQRLQDAVEREIALLLRKQEEEDDRRAELERLRALVRKHSEQKLDAELSERSIVAYTRVLAQENFSALEALERELARQLEEEEHAVLMLLLN